MPIKNCIDARANKLSELTYVVQWHGTCGSISFILTDLVIYKYLDSVDMFKHKDLHFTSFMDILSLLCFQTIALLFYRLCRLNCKFFYLETFEMIGSFKCEVCYPFLLS
ncbi:unnamed protein product [Cuscuta epithymum]|uniref:Uncharacterized protein n=1 Tax=Cuscuta epithymum TaxID=186058 RepID=A0AAV0DRD5_9ASTE|nr:unnamed protein product [Cuscuta epithymum]